MDNIWDSPDIVEGDYRIIEPGSDTQLALSNKVSDATLVTSTSKVLDLPKLQSSPATLSRAAEQQPKISAAAEKATAVACALRPEACGVAIDEAV